MVPDEAAISSKSPAIAANTARVQNREHDEGNTNQNNDAPKEDHKTPSQRQCRSFPWVRFP
jgi:hypothetical protein